MEPSKGGAVKLYSIIMNAVNVEGEGRKSSAVILITLQNATM